MSENQETIADIAEEMRSAVASMGDDLPYGITAGQVRAIADRLEAAHRREIDKLNSVIQAQRSQFDAEIDRLRREKKQWEEAACHCVSNAVQSGKIAVVHEQPGNAAKLREAVKDSNELLEELSQLGEWWDAAQDQIKANNAALSEPMRECDRFTDEKQSDALHAAFVEYCNGCNCPMGCDHRKNPRFLLDVNCASIMKCFARFALSKVVSKKGVTNGK